MDFKHKVTSIELVYLLHGATSIAFLLHFVTSSRALFFFENVLPESSILAMSTSARILSSVSVASRCACTRKKEKGKGQTKKREKVRVLVSPSPRVAKVRLCESTPRVAKVRRARRQEEKKKNVRVLQLSYVLWILYLKEHRVFFFACTSRSSMALNHVFRVLHLTEHRFFISYFFLYSVIYWILVLI